MLKKIYVEITNNCNLNCTFCNKNNRLKKFITTNEFKTLLTKLKGHTKYLYFHVMGEPLLHPNINELINLASLNYYVNITTNGYLINKIKDNKNIRQLNISLHSFDIKNIKSLDKYMEDIFDAVDILKENTYISYRMWVDTPYKDEIIKLLNNKYNTNIGNLKHIKLANNIYYDVEDTFIWPNLDNKYYNEAGTCMGLRTHIGILVDGTVVPCCLDSNGIINLGNIYNEELEDILNSELACSIRKGFLDNKKICELCKRCSFYK